MDKRLLRQNILQKRRQLSPSEVMATSAKLVSHLLTWDVLQKANICMAFLSMADEPQLDELIRHLLDQGKTVCVPRMGPIFGQMDAAAITNLRDIVTGRIGLRMPAPGSITVPPSDIEVILVPGVAFDRSGNRLGMGAGYYDRFLQYTPNAVLAGIAWGVQVVGNVPSEQHDIPMRWLVTEDGIYDCMQGKI